MYLEKRSVHSLSRHQHQRLFVHYTQCIWRNAAYTVFPGINIKGCCQELQCWCLRCRCLLVHWTSNSLSCWVDVVVRLPPFELVGGCRRFYCKLSVNHVSVRFSRYIEYNGQTMSFCGMIILREKNVAFHIHETPFCVQWGDELYIWSIPNKLSIWMWNSRTTSVYNSAWKENWIHITFFLHTFLRVGSGKRGDNVRG
jgi:hypothetical protein